MIKIKIPATSANIGSGFDSLGIALDLYNYVWMEEDDEINISSSDGVDIPTDENNLIYWSAQRLYAECGGEETVAAVTHGGMINQLFGSLLSLPLSHGVWFTTYDTGIHELELKDGKVRIIRSNYSEHANGI